MIVFVYGTLKREQERENFDLKLVPFTTKQSTEKFRFLSEKFKQAKSKYIHKILIFFFSKF